MSHRYDDPLRGTGRTQAMLEHVLANARAGTPEQYVIAGSLQQARFMCNRLAKLAESDTAQRRIMYITLRNGATVRFGSIHSQLEGWHGVVHHDHAAFDRWTAQERA